MAVVEVLIALLVLAVALLGSVSWTISSVSLAGTNEEAADATAVMRQVVEELQSLPFEEVFARFNADPSDDPDGASTAPGPTFTVAPDHTSAILPVADGAAPTTGTALSRARSFQIDLAFPVNGAGHLAENVTGGPWGPVGWDLDASGDLTGGDRSRNYQMLPVRVRVTWVGRHGLSSLEVVRLLVRRR